LTARSLTVFVLCGLLAGCTVTLRTQPPPRAGTPGVIPGRLPSSMIVANVVGSVADASNLVDQRFPDRMDLDRQCSGDPIAGEICGQATLQREPAILWFERSRLYVNALFRFRGEGRYRRLFPPVVIPVSCGDAPPNLRIRADVNVSTELRLGSDWTLKSSATRANAAVRDRCLLTIRDYDVTEKVEQAIGHALEAGVDTSITSAVDLQAALKKGVEALWQTLNRPLGPGGGRLWVDVKPEQLLVGPIEGEGETLRTTIGVRARPEISLEPPNPAGPVPPLPPAATGPFDDHTYATVQLRVPFAELSRRLGERLNGREFTTRIPLLPDPHVVIRNARVYPSNEDTVLAFDLEGSVEGTVYVRSRIWYDAIRQVIRLEWWDFALDTRSELLRSAFWLYEQFVDPTFGGLLQGGVAIDIRGLLAQVDADLDSAMNATISPNIVLHSQFQPVDLVGQYATDTDLVVVARIVGKVSMGISVGPVPTGDEVRSMSVYFLTQDDNKDEDEAVVVQLVRNGVPQPGRRFFAGLELPNNETAGPYRFAVPPGATHGQCGVDVLRIYKEPDDPDGNGSGWNTAIIVKAFYADGREREVLHRPSVRIGDDKSPELTLPICW
jgi:hypothetical protein